MLMFRVHIAHAHADAHRTGQSAAIAHQDAAGNDIDLLHGQAFSYLMMGNILLRSQLDCTDESVKG